METLKCIWNTQDPPDKSDPLNAWWKRKPKKGKNKKRVKPRPPARPSVSSERG